MSDVANAPSPIDHPAAALADSPLPHVFGEVGGVPYLAMEYVAGCDVWRLVHDHGPLPYAEACRIAYEVALALESIDRHGIVHRDLKPSNILLTEQGVAKVADLGLAKFCRNESGDLLTSADAIVGTVDYVAPEQIEPNGRVDIRADIYSLGCTLHFMLCGRAPFSGREYDSVIRKLKAHAEVVPPSIRGLRADVPAEVAAIVARMLEKRPDRRYPDAKALAKALEPHAAGADVERLVAGVAGGLREVGSVVGTTLPNTATASLAPLSLARLRPWALWGAAVCLVIALTAGAVAGLWGLGGMGAGSRPSQPGENPRPAVPAAAPAEPTFETLPPDKVESGRWYPLLNQPPEKLIWPTDDFAGRSLLFPDPKRRSLHLQSLQNAYLSLGTVESDSYTLQIDIARSSWKDGVVGVFLGYNESDGGAAATLQTFEIQRQLGADGWQHVLLRYSQKIRKDGTRLIEAPGEIRASAAIEDPGIVAATLEVRVSSGRVRSVRFNGQWLPALNDPISPAGPKPDTWRGRFGVLAAGATADFDNARIAVHDTK